MVQYGLLFKNERLIEFQAAGIPEVAKEKEWVGNYSEPADIIYTTDRQRGIRDQRHIGWLTYDFNHLHLISNKYIEI